MTAPCPCGMKHYGSSDTNGLAAIKAGAAMQGTLADPTAAEPIDPLEVDLTLLGIHSAAARTGDAPLVIARKRRAHHALGSLLAGTDAERNEHKHRATVLHAAIEQLMKE